MNESNNGSKRLAPPSSESRNSIQGAPSSKPLFSFMLAVVVFLVGIGVGYVAAPTVGGPIDDGDGVAELLNVDRGKDHTGNDVDFGLFWQVWDEVKTRHVDQPVNEVELLYGAVAGLVAGTGDPYSIFLDPSTTEEFLSEINGSFEGIGIEIGIKNEKLTVISPLKGSPAEAAGLLPGDRIAAVNGMDTAFMSLNEAVQEIRGERGTTVSLTIERESEDELFDVDIVRDVIHIESVQWEFVEKKGTQIAVIAITNFNSDTTAAFMEAVNDVVLKQPDAIVLDLRNNPGGFLDASIEIASQWVTDGDVVVYEEDSAGQKSPYTAEGGSPLASYPTLVLINGGSASASEILAGALKDHGFAEIIGTTSFGKGSVQDYQLFDDGSSLKLTVSRWLTPNEARIDGVGIYPDYEVDRTAEDFSSDRDPQLDAAELYFTNKNSFESSYSAYVPEQPEEESQEEQ